MSTTYAPNVIAKVESDLVSFGMDYRYVDGVWVNGATNLPIAEENAASFDEMLADAQVAEDAGKLKTRRTRTSAPSKRYHTSEASPFKSPGLVPPVVIPFFAPPRVPDAAPAQSFANVGVAPPPAPSPFRMVGEDSAGMAPPPPVPSPFQMLDENRPLPAWAAEAPLSMGNRESAPAKSAAPFRLADDAPYKAPAAPTAHPVGGGSAAVSREMAPPSSFRLQGDAPAPYQAKDAHRTATPQSVPFSAPDAATSPLAGLRAFGSHALQSIGRAVGMADLSSDDLYGRQAAQSAPLPASTPVPVNTPAPQTSPTVSTDAAAPVALPSTAAPQPTPKPPRAPKPAAPAPAPAPAPLPDPNPLPAFVPTAPAPGISIAQANSQMRAAQYQRDISGAIQQQTGAQTRRDPRTDAWQMRVNNQWQDADTATGAQFSKIAAQVKPPSVTPPLPSALPAAASALGGSVKGAARTISSQASQMIGSVLPALGAGAAIYNVHGAAREGEQAGRAVIDGAASLVGDAGHAGVKIAGALLDAVLSPFGASGRAATALTESLGHMAVNAITGGLKTLGNIAGAGGRAVGGVVGLGFGIGGAVIGGALGAGVGAAGGAVGGAVGAGVATGGMGVAVGAAGGAVTGAASGLMTGALVGGLVGTAAGLIAMKIASAVGDALGGVLGAIGSGLGAIGEIATAGLKTALEVVKDLAGEAQKFGRQVALISAQTGLSKNASGSMALNFNAAGAGGLLPSLTGPMGNAPMLFGMRAAVGGYKSYEDPDFLASAAERFQAQSKGGGLRAYFARAMLPAELNTPEGLAQISRPAAMIRDEQKFSRDLAGSLGLDPTKIKDLGDQITSLQNKASSAASIIKLAVVQAALPALQSLAAYVSSHSGEIVSFIKKGVDWIIHDLPPMMLNAGAVGLHALSVFAGGVSAFAETLIGNLPGILGGIDALAGGLQQFVAFAVGAAAFIMQVVHNAQAALGIGQEPAFEPGGGPGGTLPGVAGTWKESDKWEKEHPSAPGSEFHEVRMVRVGNHLEPVDPNAAKSGGGGGGGAGTTTGAGEPANPAPPAPPPPASGIIPPDAGKTRPASIVPIEDLGKLTGTGKVKASFSILPDTSAVPKIDSMRPASLLSGLWDWFTGAKAAQEFGKRAAERDVQSEKENPGNGGLVYRAADAYTKVKHSFTGDPSYIPPPGSAGTGTKAPEGTEAPGFKQIDGRSAMQAFADAQQQMLTSYKLPKAMDYLPQITAGAKWVEDHGKWAADKLQSGSDSLSKARDDWNKFSGNIDKLDGSGNKSSAQSGGGSSQADIQKALLDETRRTNQLLQMLHSDRPVGMHFRTMLGAIKDELSYDESVAIISGGSGVD